MRHGITKLRYLFMVIAMYGFVILLSGKASSRTVENDEVPSRPQQIEEHYQRAKVRTSDLENGVTAVIGKIYINASAKNIWAAITDYNNQKHFVPKLIDSGLISDNGREQVMFEKGKTGYLFFKKTVYIKLSIRGDYPQRLSFRQIEGDFKIYEGDWLIDRAPDDKGFVLTFQAKIKPNFFAPPMFVRKVQEHDLPMVLTAMKKRAESAEASLPESRASSQKKSPPPSGNSVIAE